MAILTATEAYQSLDYTSADEMPEKVTSIFLPAIDNFLKDATGKDWGTLTDTYTAIDPTAKMIAGILLVRWVEDPGQIGEVSDRSTLAFIGQLQAKYHQEIAG